MLKKTIQDIYIVKKSIRMVKKSDIKDGFFNNIKNLGTENDYDKDSNNKHAKEVEIDSVDEVIYEGGEDKNITKNTLIFLWIICIVAVAILLFVLSSMFSTSIITITPKNKSVVLNDSYDIFTDKLATGLHYQVMTIKKDLSQSLTIDGEEHVERKAIGKVVLYNNFGTASQRLIINTRLENKDGLIYKISKSVEIPGIKTISGVKTPGSIEVEIVADDVGDKYNMKLEDLKGDFSIVGFKGTPKYKLFYGRLSADAVGGIVGNVKKVSEDKITVGREELKNTIKIDLVKEVYSKKPESYVLFNNNYYTHCLDLPDDSSSSEYKINEECTINAIIFDKDELSSYIAKNKIKDFDDSKVDLLWNDNTVVTLTGTTEKPWNETSLKAKFVGPVIVVWTYDINDILSSVIGQNKSIIATVLENNKKSLLEIQTSIKPIWRNTFPDNSKKIKIIDTVRGM